MAILHGVIDDVVPLSQSCELVGTLRGVEAHHIDEAGQDLGTPPLGCEAGNIAWTPVARSTAWPAERYFLVYDGAGHEGPLQPGGARIFEDAYAFLLAKLPPATTQSQ